MKLYNLNIVIAMSIAIVFTVSVYAQQDGWNREFSSMVSDTLYIDTTGGTPQGSYFVRTKFLGTTINDSVVYGKGGFDVPFQGTLILSNRSRVSTFETGTEFEVLLHHHDTTITSWVAYSNDGPWCNQPLSSWSGTLLKFDSLSIVMIYHPLTTVFVEQTTDFDNFRVTIGVVDSMFYDGGEMGKVEGIVYHDKNQSGSRDVGEEGLVGWKMYLSSMVVDSVETTTNGQYIFSQVPRGTYTLYTESKKFWTQTMPTTTETTVVISSDAMNHTVNFGQYATSTSISYYQVKTGWNMLSLTRRVNDPRVWVLFPTATSAFEYVPNASYSTVESLKAGVGYWFKFASEQEVMIVGDSITVDTIEVQEGWNMIGAATQVVLVTDIGSNPPEMTTSQFFGYSGSYVTADTLEPGNGYWVKTDRDGELILNAGGKTSALNRISIVDRGETPPPPPESREASLSRKPTTYMLEQNYPNPFNPATIISYQLPTDDWVTLKVYNILGEEVKTLVDESQNAGYKSVKWEASGMTTGMYFYRLQTKDYVETKKLILLK